MMDMNWAWSDINYWAVVVSMVAIAVIGSLWYSPVLFLNKWLQATGMKKDDMRGKGVSPIVCSVIMALLTSFVLAVLLEMTNAHNFKNGIWTGIAVVLILLFTNATHHLFERKKSSLMMINGGYQVVSILVATIILATWQ